MRASSFRHVYTSIAIVTGVVRECPELATSRSARGDVQSLAAVPVEALALCSSARRTGMYSDRTTRENIGNCSAGSASITMTSSCPWLSIPVVLRTLYATSWTLSSHGGGVYRSADAGYTLATHRPRRTDGARDCGSP